MLNLSLDDVYISTIPPYPVSPESLTQLEEKLKCSLPESFRAFLGNFGPGVLIDTRILGPSGIQERTESEGSQLKAYGLESIPESLAKAPLNKSIVVTDSGIFFHPSAPECFFQILELSIIEIGTGFDAVIAHLRESRGDALKQLHFMPDGPQAAEVKNLMSARRKHCFDAVHLMLAPQDPDDGTTLEYDDGEGKFLLALRSINGTVACSCQPEDHRIRVAYDPKQPDSAIEELLDRLRKIGFEEPGKAPIINADAPSGSSPAVVTEDATHANERIIAIVSEYGLDKGPIAGDLVFTNCRLLFFHSYEKEVTVQEMSIQDLLSAGLRYDVYNFDNVRKIVLKRNLFGRSVAVVTPKNAAKNKFWGPKKNLDAVIEAAQELRELGLPLHIAL